MIRFIHYRFPLRFSLDDGWVISEEDVDIYLAGADSPSASYEWEWGLAD